MLKRRIFSILITSVVSATIFIILFPLNFNGLSNEVSHMQNIYTSIVIYPVFILLCLIVFAVPLSILLDYLSRKISFLSITWVRLLLYILLALPIYYYFKELGAIVFSMVTAVIFWGVSEIYRNSDYSAIHRYLDQAAVAALVIMLVSSALAMAMTG